MAKSSGADGGGTPIVIRFPSDAKFLDMLHQLTKQLAGATGFGESEADSIAVAVDEATTNVIQHAYAGETDHEIEVQFDPEGDSLDVMILHDGTPLEEVPLPELDLDRLVAERRKGGLGLFLMRQVMDRVDYETSDSGQNMCVMVRYKQRSQDEAS